MLCQSLFSYNIKQLAVKRVFISLKVSHVSSFIHIRKVHYPGRPHLLLTALLALLNMWLCYSPPVVLLIYYITTRTPDLCYQCFRTISRLLPCYRNNNKYWFRNSIVIPDLYGLYMGKIRQGRQKNRDRSPRANIFVFNAYHNC